MGNVVITGGSGGLGSAVAECFRSAGHQVETPCRAELDVSDQAAVARWFPGRRIDLLICCAGMTRDAPLARLTSENWDETLRVNFFGARACAAAALAGMASLGGHIVMISSYSAYHPPAGQAAYATAKALLLDWVRASSVRYGRENIRINAVLPGFLETRMTAGVSETRRAEILAAHVLRRFNTPERVAGFVRFLHDEMPDTSGQVFQLDSRPNVF